ncbi:hypothetical protein [Sphingomonas sp.]|jgi:hypothetical protein|uniref:hypothetical protein n=1 Tax=Sphingomonas sp. TaxID=28214 RepID=UPI002ED979BD
MNWRNRKTRIAIVLAFAVLAAFVAWRTSTPVEAGNCQAGREEVKDASGKVVEIRRHECG